METLNHFFDNIVRPRFHFLGRNFSAFLIMGWIGYIAMNIYVLIVSQTFGMPLWGWAAMSAIGALMFFAMAYLTRWIYGRENLVFYQFTLTILIVLGIFYFAAGQPVLAWLDLYTLGLGLFTFFGRQGCLMAGCCYGVPHKVGVCYGHKHHDSGFPRWLQGIRLFPTQAIESLAGLLICLTGSLLVLGKMPPGSALAWYYTLYDSMRYFLEFRRGDAERPYWKGLSEAQWTAVLMTTTISILEITSVLPFFAWHLGLTALLWIVSAVVIWRWYQKSPAERRLFTLTHKDEIGKLLQSGKLDQTTLVPGKDGNRYRVPEMCMTSRGLKMTRQKRTAPNGAVTWHIGISLDQGTLEPSQAQRLAAVIKRLSHCGGTVTKGKEGVYHLVLGVGL